MFEQKQDTREQNSTFFFIILIIYYLSTKNQEQTFFWKRPFWISIVLRQTEFDRHAGLEKNNGRFSSFPRGYRALKSMFRNCKLLETSRLCTGAVYFVHCSLFSPGLRAWSVDIILTIHFFKKKKKKIQVLWKQNIFNPWNLKIFIWHDIKQNFWLGIFAIP